MPSRRLRTAGHIALVASLAVVFAGCSGPEHDDLRQYVAQIKSRPAGHIAPLPEFESYESYAYSASKLRDPFAGEQVAVLQEATKETGSGLQPDRHRNKEALEAFPLDTLNFVGLLEKGEEAWAIVTAPDGLVHRVKPGNYMGQNNGRVLKITENAISLREIAPDGYGGWIERDAAIAIRE